MHTELPSCQCSRGSSPPSCSCSSASWLWWYVRTPTLGRFALCDGRISQPCSGMGLSCPTAETGCLYSLRSPFVLGLEMYYSISNLTSCLVKCQTKNRNPFEFLFPKNLMKKFLLPFQNMVRADLFSGSLAVWNVRGGAAQISDRHPRRRRRRNAFELFQEYTVIGKL